MKFLNINKLVLLNYGLPLLIILFSVALALSPLLVKYPDLAAGIVYDLTLIAPISFLFLSKKSKASKIKAVPFFIGGIVIATYVLPENGQEHLNFIKTYVLPIVEIVVLVVLSSKIYKGIKTFQQNSNQTTDFYAISKVSAKELFPDSRYASLFASEITMLYYAFFSWKFRKLKNYEFTNYKENASLALAGALIMVLLIETYAFHILLMKWSSIGAWILTGLSIYSMFSIIAHMKALLIRPTILTDYALIIKNGLIADITIPLKTIKKIEGFSKEMVSKDMKIGNLGLSKESTNHNIAIHFNKPQVIEKMYGFSQHCDILLVHLDEKNRMLNLVNEKLNELST